MKRDGLTGNVEASCDEPDDGHEDVLDHGTDNRRERGADDEADREVDDVATHDELLELFEERPHEYSPETYWANGYFFTGTSIACSGKSVLGACWSFMIDSRRASAAEFVAATSVVS